MFFIDEEDEYNKKNDIVQKYILDNKSILTEWIEISEDKLNKDDKIYIYYSSDSQRYMYTLYPKCGQILTMSNNNSDIFIKNPNNEIESIFHYNLSYYGDQRGYTCQIYKLVTNLYIL
jgi:hypothetical protein